MDDAATGRGDQTTVAGATGSARGWSGIQLAVLAFIGFCGVLTDGRPDLPRWLQTTAALLSVLALVVACVGVFLVASVAWPLTARRRRERPASADVDPPGGVGPARLRVGVVLTFVAVALMALAASANWWPVEATPGGANGSAAAADDGAVVAAVDAAGNTWCGRLADGGRDGTVVLTTARGDVELLLARLAALDPVVDC